MSTPQELEKALSKMDTLLDEIVALIPPQTIVAREAQILRLIKAYRE